MDLTMADKPGPTGEFSRGMATPDDEGDLNIRFDIKMGMNGTPIIVMSFGKDVGWVGLEPDGIDGICEVMQRMKKQALEMAKKVN